VCGRPNMGYFSAAEQAAILADIWPLIESALATALREALEEAAERVRSLADTSPRASNENEERRWGFANAQDSAIEAIEAALPPAPASVPEPPKCGAVGPSNYRCELLAGHSGDHNALAGILPASVPEQEPSSNRDLRDALDRQYRGYDARLSASVEMGVTPPAPTADSGTQATERAIAAITGVTVNLSPAPAPAEPPRWTREGVETAAHYAGANGDFAVAEMLRAYAATLPKEEK
jgi:hypothetical protein